MINGYIKSRESQNATLSLSTNGRIKVALKRFDQLTGEEVEPMEQEIELEHLVREKEHLTREIEEKTKQLEEISAVLGDIQTRYNI